MKAGFSTGASDPRVVATELFKEEVETATDGRITIEIHSDGELGADEEFKKATASATDTFKDTYNVDLLKDVK